MRSPLDGPMDDADAETLAQTLRVLSSPSRLRLLSLIAEQPRSVEELAPLLGLSQPTVSHHVTRLREAGLVIRGEREWSRWPLTVNTEALTQVGRVLARERGET